MCTCNGGSHCSSSDSGIHSRTHYTYFTNAAGTIVLATPNAVAASGTYYIKGTTAGGCSRYAGGGNSYSCTDSRDYQSCCGMCTCNS